MLRRFRQRQRNILHRKTSLSPIENNNVLRAVNGLLREDRKRTYLRFQKTSPVVNEIFIAAGNHDVRFEFASISFDECHCEKISENEYNLLCDLKEVPYHNLRFQGDEGSGSLTVRLSRSYEESCGQVSWEDICLLPNTSGLRFFSTTKLLHVLKTTLEHAIRDVLQSRVSSGTTVKCRVRSERIVIDVKVDEDCVSFNLLPVMQLSKATAKEFALYTKIKQISKPWRTVSAGNFYLAAKPGSEYPEKLWRITVNNFENNLIRRMKATTECASKCLFTVSLLNKQYFAEQDRTPLPYFYIRMALLTEFLKFPREDSWKKRHFTERIESIFHTLETNLYKGEFKSIFTGVNIFGHKESEYLAELCNHVKRLRSSVRSSLLNLLN